MPDVISSLQVSTLGVYMDCSLAQVNLAYKTPFKKHSFRRSWIYTQPIRRAKVAVRNVTMKAVPSVITTLTVAHFRLLVSL